MRAERRSCCKPRRDAGTPTIIASTSEVYGHSLRFPSREDDPISIGSPTIGRWSYACAKIYDEFYALALHRERELPVVISRLFNTVGARQTGRYGMVIPRLIAQALAHEPLTVYGDGTQTRCFCAVEDVVGVLSTQLERFGSVSGEIFNIGNPDRNVDSRPCQARSSSARAHTRRSNLFPLARHIRPDSKRSCAAFPTSRRRSASCNSNRG